MLENSKVFPPISILYKAVANTKDLFKGNQTWSETWPFYHRELSQFYLAYFTNSNKQNPCSFIPAYRRLLSSNRPTHHQPVAKGNTEAQSHAWKQIWRNTTTFLHSSFVPSCHAQGILGTVLSELCSLPVHSDSSLPAPHQPPLPSTLPGTSNTWQAIAGSHN